MLYTVLLVRVEAEAALMGIQRIAESLAPEGAV
jgi:hypothetical protein